MAVITEYTEVNFFFLDNCVMCFLHGKYCVAFKPPAIFWVCVTPLFFSSTQPWKDSIVTCSLPEWLSGNRTTQTAFLKKRGTFLFCCPAIWCSALQFFSKFRALWRNYSFKYLKKCCTELVNKVKLSFAFIWCWRSVFKAFVRKVT